MHNIHFLFLLFKSFNTVDLFRPRKLTLEKSQNAKYNLIPDDELSSLNIKDLNR